jgi:tetratricopeptide (TPR) repeat protein
MATSKNKPRGKKNDQGNELLENPEVLKEQLSRSEEFLRKNRNLVFGLGGFIAAVIAGILIYQYIITNRNQTAQEEMFQAVFYFENGEFDNALFGDGNYLGFQDIMDNFGGTKAANLAKFYAGVIRLEKGEFEIALSLLKSFSSDDYLISARKEVLIGDAHMELGNFADAARAYDAGANTNSNKFFSPQYLMKAAWAYERAGDNTKALDRYNQIIERFPESPELISARKFKARLEGLAAR